MVHNDFILIDSYDFMNNRTVILPSKLIESIICYDRVIFDISQPKDKIVDLIRLIGSDLLEEYLKTGILNFALQDISYRVSTSGKLINYSYLGEDLDIEEELNQAIEECCIHGIRKKQLVKLISDRTKSISINESSRKLIFETILKEMNDIELHRKIIDRYMSNFKVKLPWEEVKYRVILEKENFKIEIDSNNIELKNEIGGILGIIFMMLLYANYFTYESNVIGANGIWADNCTSDILDNKFSTLLRKMHNDIEVFNAMMKKEKIPDIDYLYKYKRIDFKNAIVIRNKSQRLRELIKKSEFSSEDELYCEYLNLIQNNIKFIDKLPMKIARFVLFSVIGGYLGGNAISPISGGVFGSMIGGALPSAFDTFLLPHIPNKSEKYVRFKDLFNDIN